VYKTEAAPQNTATRYPDNYQLRATEPVNEQYVNPYAMPAQQPVRKPVEQPAQQPQYVNPYAAPSAPEQYVHPYAMPAQQPVRKPVEQPAPQPRVNPYAAQESFPSYVPPVQQQSAYKVNTVYQGPSDEFMRKLTNDEKIEFSMTFIEKSKGDIGKVPDYVIGGDNKKFFSSVFIYLGRVRNLISDGLLNKMYKELNMLK
ncbi:MAG: hypothetical protein K2G96_01925, partial [Clostridia bacterium]|nr:hypothetical protein [Clostridia bacterium]